MWLQTVRGCLCNCFWPRSWHTSLTVPSRFPNRRAKDLIQTNIAVLHRVAEVLLEKEQIDGDEFQRIMMEEQASQYLKNDSPETTVPYQAA